MIMFLDRHNWWMSRIPVGYKMGLVWDSFLWYLATNLTKFWNLRSLQVKAQRALFEAAGVAWAMAALQWIVSVAWGSVPNLLPTTSHGHFKFIGMLQGYWEEELTQLQSTQYLDVFGVFVRGRVQPRAWMLVRRRIGGFLTCSAIRFWQVLHAECFRKVWRCFMYSYSAHPDSITAYHCEWIRQIIKAWSLPRSSKRCWKDSRKNETHDACSFLAAIPVSQDHSPP